MTTPTCVPGPAGQAALAASLDAGRGTRQGTNVVRCADAARRRGEPLAASAVRYSRFLLLEVPGPWGTSALDGKHIESGVARKLARAAAASDAHVLLIRRHSRRPAPVPGMGGRPMAWAIADASAGTERVLWGSWRDPGELLGLDLAAPLPASAAGTGPQRLALVCTNGKRDQCCALRGRPVAGAIADGTDWDTWECSHLGGHRFAATMMLLPTGDMFGWLDEGSAVEVTRRFDAGELVLPHYRGRCGQPEQVQAALHAAALRLGDSRRGVLQVSRSAGTEGRWEVDVVHRAGPGRAAAYRVALAGSASTPTFLSCGDGIPKAETHYEAVAFIRLA
jgi:hypothetical protein